MSQLFVLCLVGFVGCDSTNISKDQAADRKTNPPQVHQDPEPKSEDVREIGKPDSAKTGGPIEEPDNASVATQDSPLRDIRPPADEEPEPEYVEKQTIDIPNNWTRITPIGASEVWVDTNSKQVIVAGRICLDRGGLEMFICPFNTKEHESVIAVNCQSFQIHAALLALGTNPGTPVRWEPEYQPAKGPIIEIDVMWKNTNDEIVVKRAQTLVRSFKTKKPLELDWVFGGSILETDEESGQSFYYADGGELVCLSNFSTAAMDLPIQSSESNEDLLYEANPETVPAPGTKVYVVFKPKTATITSDN